MLCGCEPKQDPLIGTWTVEKVKVQFDESRSTPELVKQVGEMERQNTFTIGMDSSLVFKGLEETREGRISLRNNDTLLFDSKVFGLWKDGLIVTRTNTPLGEVLVIYRKKD